MNEQAKCGLFTREGAQVPLQGVEVSGELLGGHARVRVTQRYRNDEKKPVEAIYTFPLPSDATLSAFSMTCAGRRVAGVVKEREAAFRAYDDAITEGHGAALLDQERANVFTAQVGNLLPGEETLVEVEFLQTLTAEEGSVRWMLPTLVAPRYIPGAVHGDRTGHGSAAPTTRVPDADRITPPTGSVDYGLRMDLLIDVGRDVVVESPSHRITVTKEGTRMRVNLQRDSFHKDFAGNEVALDRDVVLTMRNANPDVMLTPVVTHRKAEGPGTFALTVVPDLLNLATTPPRQEVVFVVDTSGSMSGDSLPQAQAALRLCLRHLREGDRFNVIAFENSFRSFSAQTVPFTQRTLEQADAWVAGLKAYGGTELLEPMVTAMKAAPDGVVVLLTDGQVGNEREILDAVLAARGTGRVFSFGIGTNVSDALLRDLARRTDGAVEFIHPGERIDEKVVAQFSRALAPRVTDLEVRFDGVEASELAPATLPPLVDGTPWTLFGRYAQAGTGSVTLKGKSGREPFSLTVRLDLPAQSERPVVEKLWAAERIRGWMDAGLVGRRAEAMKERIVRLAIEHQLATQYTSFVVVEERQGDRRASGTPDTRVVPVNAPAGWSMFNQAARDMDDEYVPEGGLAPEQTRVMKRKASKPMPAPAAAPGGVGRSRGGAVPPPPPSMAAPAPAPAGDLGPEPTTGSSFQAEFADGSGPMGGRAAPMERREQEVAKKDQGGFFDRLMSAARPSKASRVLETAPELERVIKGKAEVLYEQEEVQPLSVAEGPMATEDVGSLLGQQLANGLWAGTGEGPEPVRQARATARVLLVLLREGITSSHPLHGAQVKKAVDALLALASQLGQAPDVAELALGVAWLVAAGPRTRGRIEQAAKPLPGLDGRLGDMAALRQHMETLATR
ncbi:von Willebrand factor type A domain-containing protein [Corallococcus coralloides DSM 2259]|uniref:von Willebrand factor type A domain-containing protein n=1 Tax=Corallococcus coralloides (strain ATCC 25202 / DSM 2259 / NBRC 100086 / M2) TaxID=1144275 RepID=H8MG34_CORCM|nr:VIT domain-containing protein [Corallococcus coralloides]AFE10894.1 von Willebrand factor type A domain-containing protein [Corallococcus coralloides DSM 2259]